MRDNTHFYKTYAIRNMKTPLKLDRSVFYIYVNSGRDNGLPPVDATRSLHEARRLIDLWTAREDCACGSRRLPYEYRCWSCLRRRAAIRAPKPPRARRRR